MNKRGLLIYWTVFMWTSLKGGSKSNYKTLMRLQTVQQIDQGKYKAYTSKLKFKENEKVKKNWSKVISTELPSYLK